MNDMAVTRKHSSCLVGCRGEGGGTGAGAEASNSCCLANGWLARGNPFRSPTPSRHPVPQCLRFGLLQATKKSKNPSVALTAGCIAGGIEAMAVWPMEFMKTQLQLMEKLPAGEKPKFTGVISGLQYTVKTTGFFSLYRGLAPTLLGSMPKAGIRFGVNTYLKGKFMDENGKLSPGRQFAAGAGAGVVEAIIAVTPVETVKTKAIQQGNMSFATCMKHILKNEGPAGLYQGVGATIMKQASNQGFRFMWFNKYKDIVSDHGKTQLNPIQNLLGGMSAGCFSTMCNNPFDVLKTRMQGLDAGKCNTMDCAQKILKNEGIGGFYKGVIPRLGRVVPGQGIIFMSYEFIERWVAGIVEGKK
ncbi:unnamed protein product [Chrysoparadoxa australica]